ncbi:MAG: iron dependent repressor, metal binding and dimerization domain protein [bacterium]
MAEEAISLEVIELAHPFVFLLIAALTGGIFLRLFWTDRGLFWRWKRGLASTRRVLMEDALKHLYDQEYHGIICTLQSLAGALAIAGDEAANLMVRLQSLGLVKAQHDGFELTLEGRKEALRMIRIHRLWEKYLADETGLAETEWHKRAEKLEHGTTEEEIRALAASTGNPTYDPHGDPIPTASGKLPPKKGEPLTDLDPDDMARIIHIEDEPATVYAQLVAEGLYPGMMIRMLEKSPRRLQFIADGEEIILAPVVAANLTVERLPGGEKMRGPFDTLLSLHVGEKGEVISLSANCRGQQRRRMMDLGILPGTIISMEMHSASGDPTAYNIRGATIALRKSQAEMVHIKRIKEAA